MADGTKRPIDQVKIGDTVTATDPKTGKTDDTIVDIKIHGEHGDETIAATVVIRSS